MAPLTSHRLMARKIDRHTLMLLTVQNILNESCTVLIQYSIHYVHFDRYLSTTHLKSYSVKQYFQPNSELSLFCFVNMKRTKDQLIDARKFEIYFVRYFEVCLTQLQNCVASIKILLREEESSANNYFSFLDICSQNLKGSNIKSCQTVPDTKSICTRNRHEYIEVQRQCVRNQIHVWTVNLKASPMEQG